MGADLLLLEADGLSVHGGQEDVLIAVGELDPDQRVVLLQRDGAYTGDPWTRIGHQISLLDQASPGREYDVAALLELPHGQKCRDLLAVLKLQQVHHRPTLGRAAALRQLVDLDAVDLADGGEEQDVRVGGGNEQRFDKVLVPGRGADLALAAAVLRTVQGDGVTLDIPLVGHGDHHVLLHDQVLDGYIVGLVDDGGAAHVAVGLLDLPQFVDNDRVDLLLVGQDTPQLGDGGPHGLVLLDDLVTLQPGQPLQAHFQDGLGLGLRKAEVGHEAFPRGAGIARLADQGDDRIEIVQGDLEPFEDVQPLLGLPQVVGGPPDDRFPPVPEKRLEDLLQVQQLRAVVNDGEHVDAEGFLKARVLVQGVDDDLRHGVALELNDDAHAVAVGLVPQVGDALDLLVVDQVGHLFQEPGLVHHVRNFRDDDLLLARSLDGLGEDPGAHLHAAPSGLVALADTFTPVNEPRGGKVGPGNVLHQLVDGQPGPLHQRDKAVDDLVQVVRRDVGGHAHGNTRGAVDEQVGQPRRQHRRLLEESS